MHTQLAALQPDQRHVLLELLRHEPLFACLFTYNEQVCSLTKAMCDSCMTAALSATVKLCSPQGGRGAARPAISTRATDEHKQVLARLKTRASEQQGSEPASQPTASVEQAVQAAVQPAAPAPAAAKYPALAAACSTEFALCGPAATTARVVVSLKAAAQEEQRQVRLRCQGQCQHCGVTADADLQRFPVTGKHCSDQRPGRLWFDVWRSPEAARPDKPLPGAAGEIMTASFRLGRLLHSNLQS